MSDSLIKSAAPAFSTGPRVGFAGDHADVFLRRMPDEYKHAKIPSSEQVLRQTEGNGRLLPLMRDMLRVEPNDHRLLIPSNYYAKLAEIGKWIDDLAAAGDAHAQDLSAVFAEHTSLTQEAIRNRYSAIVC